jgi:thiamine-phosphate pyrophosphorylase
MTDERQGEGLWTALRRLPRGSGVVFRHYSLPVSERAALFARVQRIAIKRRLLLIAAGRQPLPAAGEHGRGIRKRRNRFLTVPVHSLRELRAAEWVGADLLFVSPVFPTRSHPGARVLRPHGFAALARKTRLPVVALGGMNERRARSLKGAYGWAAIDAWLA